MPGFLYINYVKPWKQNIKTNPSLRRALAAWYYETLGNDALKELERSGEKVSLEYYSDEALKKELERREKNKTPHEKLEYIVKEIEKDNCIVINEKSKDKLDKLLYEVLDAREQ